MSTANQNNMCMVGIYSSIHAL